MGENDLIDLVRAYVWQGDLVPPLATAEAVAELEAAVGYPMPSLLRRIYLEVADGGFGYVHKALSLAGHPGQWDRMIDEYRNWRAPRMVEAGDGYGDEPYIHPRSVVPFVDLGCAMWLLVDFSTPQGRTWGWDPNMFCERHMLYPEPYTVADHLLDWARDDARLRGWRPEPNRRCKVCRER